jgi:hypothetical protein
MISAVHRTRPTLACPYKIGLILFLLSAIAAMGESPNPSRRRPLKRKEGSCSWTFASSSSRSWSHRRPSKTRRAEHQEHHAAHACVVAANDKVYRELKPACPHPAEPPRRHGIAPNRLQAHGEPSTIYLGVRCNAGTNQSPTYYPILTACAAGLRAVLAPVYLGIPKTIDGMSKAENPDRHTICLMKFLNREMILLLPFIRL